MQMPQEVAIAKKAYYDAYNEIKDKVRANYRKYVGTKFEDCPPLIKEQGQFFVKKAALDATTKRLLEEYGECLSQWAFWVSWYEKKRIQTKALPMEKETKEKR